jgi:aspartate/tyrosine/aromatic aminotransferase
VPYYFVMKFVNLLVGVYFNERGYHAISKAVQEVIDKRLVGTHYNSPVKLHLIKS